MVTDTEKTTWNTVSNKVDKVAGKQLSTEDYTSPEKIKLAGIAEGANNYVHPSGDGNLHVPTTGTTNNGKVLTAGTTAGSLSWTSLPTSLPANGGNATTATSSPLLSCQGTYVSKFSDLPATYGYGITNSFVQGGADGWPNFGSLLTMRTYSSGGGTLQLYSPYSQSYGGTRLQYRLGNYEVNSGNSWTAMQTLANLSDIPSSLPANGGTSAVCSGNAATATKLQTARTINGVAFDGISC